MHLWYSAADLFCLMSGSEGCPNVVLEALACGAPVIASSVGGVPEIVTSESQGILVDEPSPEACARAIARGLERRWDRAAIRREMASRTWTATAERVQEVFAA